MIVELLTLGNELLDGRRIDSNTAWIGRFLTGLGLDVRYRQTTQDRKEDIVAAFRLALTRADLIISTGGLGPTQDDITFESLAVAINQPLEYHADIFQEIEKKYEKRGLPCPPSNKRQAMLPKTAYPIPAVGTAPGCYVEVGSRKVFAFPGVPVEMQHMFQTFFKDKLKEQQNIRPIFQLGYSISGIAEALVEDRILKLGLDKYAGAEVNVAYTASQSEVDVTYSILPNNDSDREKIQKDLHQQFLNAFSQNLIKWEDQTIEEHIVKALLQKKWKLGIAESITGGMIASKIVNVPGCSEVLDRGFVTYSYQSKKDLLNVRQETLDQHGAVSAECVLEMVQGMKRNTKVDIAVSISGIAGPGGATDKKPLGLTYIGWMGPPVKSGVLENYVKSTKIIGPTPQSADINKNQQLIEERIFNDEHGFARVQGFVFTGDRTRNRVMAANQALMGLYRLCEAYASHR